LTGGFLAAEAAPVSRIWAWVRRFGLGRKFAVFLAVSSLASAVATYAALSGSLPSGRDISTVKTLLLLDAVLFLLLFGIVAVRFVGIWIERRRGAIGARLHTRLVALFSLVALTPALIVSVYAGVFFRVGLEDWFAERVRTAISESSAVAQAYLEEHQQVIRGDVLAMARDLSRFTARSGLANPSQFNRIVATQGMIRNLTEATVFDGNGRVAARWTLGFVLDHDPLPMWAVERARGGDVVLLTNEKDDRLRAVVRIDDASDSFLYVGRSVSPRVINHLERVNQAAAQYESIKGEQRSIEVRFYMMFVLVAFLLLLAAIWLGLNFATRLAQPISELVSAAERVRAGDLSTRVRDAAEDDEIGTLSRAFNRMTGQIEAQRSELIEANRQLETRRKFMENVLSGVSAGVIGLDADGRIHLPNRSASELLSTNLETRIGQPLATVLPEIADLLAAARDGAERAHEGQVNLLRDGRTRTLLVRVACDRVGDALAGFVVTFDDVTELIAAQRKAAWSDVARRIAHEIKNPLTPIQLSAERLRRKYLREIQSDPTSFAMCTDTIIRHVDDIGRMVSEFSAFARMPAPVMKDEDVADICRRAVMLQETAHPDIDYAFAAEDDGIVVACDVHQIGQALTNLLQNAADAIDARRAGEGTDRTRGRIDVGVRREAGRVVIEVTDNGIGLPVKDRERLTEPYVTTRARGTGLGLAIVRKIMEDHGGALRLDDAPSGGAKVQVVFTTERSPISRDAPGDVEPLRVGVGHGA
jgi:two-component system nitrogen regulation sensor histidine kinase NtrY